MAHALGCHSVSCRPSLDEPAIDALPAIDRHRHVVAGLHRMQAEGSAGEHKVSWLQRCTEASKVAPQPLDGLFGSARQGP